MADFYKITGYWKHLDVKKFNEKNKWIGHILVDDDCWFEGIVRDPNSPYAGNRFVFGVFDPEKGLDLLKLAPREISNPLRFSTAITEGAYVGDLNFIGPFGEEPFGHSIIHTYKPILTREYVPILKNAIDDWKQTTDEDNLIFYNNTVAIKNEIIPIVKNSFSNNYSLIDENYNPHTKQDVSNYKLVKKR